MKYFKRMIFLFFLCLIAWLINQAVVDKPDDDLAEPVINLYLHQQNETISLNLEDYIVGTVAAEMPASFSMEALKAQAVCARTYALKKLIEKHPYPQGADLSDDINSCQAFTNVLSGDLNADHLKKIKEAVRSTRGEVLLYNSQPIDALYHSTCGGKTESAWGEEGNAPYLQSVKCGYCTESPHYHETHKFKNQTLNALVGDRGRKLSLKIISFSPSGRVNQLSINGKKLYAARLRQELDLPSQWFEFAVNKKDTTFYTHGYGHGMGMCQYGANGMGKQGKSYRQILEHYYHNIKLYKITY